ncbi:MAG: protein kinase [Acidobacteria bacterium]|nr:protein kinase [Acidobacteriota bacterium]
MHRDIKPDNVMVRRDSLVKVLDFGLAKPMKMRSAVEKVENEEKETLLHSPKITPDSASRIPNSPFLTDPGMVMGTPQYMSPEQARGLDVDARSDIFSFGIVLYEMLSGKLPFNGPTISDILVSLLNADPAPLSRFTSELSPQIEQIVAKCLIKDRKLRCQSARELLTDLKTPETQIITRSLPQKAPLSIAVLPFVNMSADAENEYFCDGLAEELLNGLSKIEALRVAARTSAFSFKGKETDIRDIGQRLGVSSVLEGSVRKAGNRLRITAQLVNVADGYHLWSERYDRELKDIFDIQDEITLAIVAALKVKLIGDAKAAVLKRYTDNTEVYQLYLKGRYHYSKSTGEGFRNAISFFEQAIEKDPDYAPAHAGLVNVYIFLWISGYVSPNYSVPKALEESAKALAIDDTLPESHLALGLLKAMYEWDRIGAEQEIKRAIDLNPNFADSHLQYGGLLAAMGRIEEAQREVKLAIELDPLSLLNNLYIGFIYYWMGLYDQIIEQGNRLIELEPSFFGGYWLIGIEAWARGRYEQAIGEYEKAISLGGDQLVLSQLGCLYGISGDSTKAQQVLEQFESQATQKYRGKMEFALVYAGLGDLDRAFELLNEAYEMREFTLRHLESISLLIPGLNSDPRLAGLLRRINLT